MSDILTNAQVRIKVRKLSPGKCKKILEDLDERIEEFEGYLGPDGDRHFGEPSKESRLYLKHIREMREIIKEEGSKEYDPRK